MVSSESLLSPDGITPVLGELSSSWLVIAANCLAIEKQPDFTLSLIATLPEDQAVFRQHIRDYQFGPNLSAGILNCYQMTMTIANKVQNTMALLLPLAKRLDRGRKNNSRYEADLNTFRSVLTNLETDTTSLDPNDHSALLGMYAVHEDLKRYFGGKIEDDIVRIETIVKHAKYIGDIAALRQQIGEVQGQIDGINKWVANLAIRLIPEALKFGFVIGKAAAADASTGTIILNIGFKVIEEAGKDYKFIQEIKKKDKELDAKIQEYRNLVVKLAGEEQEMSILLTIAGHGKKLGSNLKISIGDVATLIENIRALRSGIQRLKMVDAPLTRDYFVNQLRSAGGFWAVIAEECQNILSLSRKI